MVAVRDIKIRRGKAQAAFDRVRPMREDFYTYVVPYREGLSEQIDGQDRANLVYDHTPILAAFRGAGKLQRDLSPVDGVLYELKPGPLVKARFGEQVHVELAKQLQGISAVTASFNKTGEWDTAFWEMGLDLQGGQGFMLMLEGKHDHLPVRYISVPMDEVMLERGPYGDPWAIFWSRKFSKRMIEAMYPDGDYGPNFRDLKDDDEVKFHQDSIWLDDKQRWRLVCWADCDEKQIHKEESRTCMWLTPSYFRVPGEVYGRGTANLAMPSIKTLNTAQRIQLMAAAIAMLGIYTAVDDGVFNPDLSPIEPGAIWKVRANGGVMGESIKRFPTPQIDLSQIVIDDLRMNIKAGMMDDALPPDTAAVKSPTEILERVKRLADDHVGAFGRLVREIIIPKARRDIELAFNKGLIQQDVNIDQLLVRVEVNSPIALSREAERVQNIVRWLELVIMMTQTAPGEVDLVARKLDALADMGEAMNVPTEYIVPKKERDEEIERRRKLAEAAQALEAATAAAPQGAAQ